MIIMDLFYNSDQITGISQAILRNEQHAVNNSISKVIPVMIAKPEDCV